MFSPEPYSVTILDRGGKVRMGELHDIQALTWNRTKDAIATNEITIGDDGKTYDSSWLSKTRAMRHEMRIYRGSDIVMEGPITRIRSLGTGLTLYGADPLYYWSRTAIEAPYSSANPHIETAVGRITRIAVAELARKEALGYNLKSFITAHHFKGEANTSAVTLGWQISLWSHLDQLAQTGGIDYVALGRAVHIWDTSFSPFGQTPVVTQSDFLGQIDVSEYGADLVTQAIASDGQGNFGIAGGVDPYYGEVQVIDVAYDAASATTAAPTKAALTSQAQRDLAGGNPTPVQVSIPTTTGVNPRGVLEFKHFVPGIYFPLRADTGVRTLTQMQKLMSVQGTVGNDGESIQVTLAPANNIDLSEAD